MGCGYEETRIICKLKESYKYKKKYLGYKWNCSFFSYFLHNSGETSPKFIKDSKLYIQSLIDGDPNYEKLKEKVSIYVYNKKLALMNLKRRNYFKERR